MGSEFGIFGGFGWVRSSVLVGKPGFERVRSSTSRVRSSSKFVIFGFDPTLVSILLCRNPHQHDLMKVVSDLSSLENHTGGFCI